ncbi:MAG: S8 family serine peptidase [Flavobacteriaceae bacterium]
MKLSYFNSLLSFVIIVFSLYGCGSTVLVTTPVENIDSVPLKISELTEEEKKSWGHLDLVSDTIPGMSVNKAYDEIIGTKKGKTVIVAVVDSGIDLGHEDLDGVLWTNRKEKPGNNKDDDGNGFVDDIHGYNFLGESYDEQLELSRILKLKLGDAALQAKAKAEQETKFSEAQQNTQRYEQILQTVKGADAAVKKHLGKDNYTKEEVMAIESEDQDLQQQIAVLKQMYTFEDTIPDVLEALEGGIDYFTQQLNYHYNISFDGRKTVGDDPYDIMDLGYGNGNPNHRVDDENHGTHVAGIIAAERNNGLGANGVANNVQIMSVRAVPNGDEYDKDIALAIRYATDNGASIINCSFGKSYSPNADWVYEAIKYAASKDVLIVHAAGNDGADLDNPSNPNYPNDQFNNGPEISDNVITVGSLNRNYGSEMVSSFSNYGKINVDVFAPGGQIYSTLTNNEYDFQGGTSMAAPAVAGVAALIRSYYPKLSASQVKRILMDSGLSTKSSVVLAGDVENAKDFDQVSKSGKMVNAYNAMIMADQVAKGKLNK